MKTSILLKFYLAGHTPEFQVGALLEDYLTDANKHSYPEGIIEGYQQQQYISSFLVKHPAYLKSEKLLDDKLRQSADKIIPLFYDHFLRMNWDEFSNETFEAFYRNLSLNLNDNQKYWPDKHSRLLNIINDENWYDTLQTIVGTHLIMKEQTKRSTFYSSMEYSIHSLVDHYEEYRNHFLEIIPDLKEASYVFRSLQKETVAAL